MHGILNKTGCQRIAQSGALPLCRRLNSLFFRNMKLARYVWNFKRAAFWRTERLIVRSLVFMQHIRGFAEYLTAELAKRIIGYYLTRGHWIIILYIKNINAKYRSNDWLKNFIQNSAFVAISFVDLRNSRWEIYNFFSPFV